MSEINTPQLTKKDFESDQAVRWCLWLWGLCYTSTGPKTNAYIWS